MSDSRRLNVRTGYRRLHRLDCSIFPPKKRAAYLGEEDPELDIPRKTRLSPSHLHHNELMDSAESPEPLSAAESWRQRGDFIYTGEAMVYAPPHRKPYYNWNIPPQPEILTWPETLVFPKETPFISMFNSPGFDPTALSPPPHPPSPPPSPAPSARAKLAPIKSAPTKFHTPKHKHTPTRSRTDSLFTTRTRIVSSPPREITHWDDAALLRLWRWKIVKKKGFAPMLRAFPGQTEESLRGAWEMNRDECRRLGREWEKK
jgi:hypothetical protein